MFCECDEDFLFTGAATVDERVNGVMLRDEDDDVIHR
jgi:hypothetical protein